MGGDRGGAGWRMIRGEWDDRKDDGRISLKRVGFGVISDMKPSRTVPENSNYEHVYSFGSHSTEQISLA